MRQNCPIWIEVMAQCYNDIWFLWMNENYNDEGMMVQMKNAMTTQENHIKWNFKKTHPFQNVGWFEMQRNY